MDQAQEFDRFVSLNNIKHLTSSQYHPATNGQVERLVQTLKQALKSLTPTKTRSTLKASTRQVMSHSAATERLFSPGEKVLVRDYRPGHARWQSGVVVKAVGVKTSRELTEEVDAGPPSRAASEGGMLPQPHTSAKAASEGGMLPQPHTSARAASEGGMLSQPHTSATTESHPLATETIPFTPEELCPSATEVVPTDPRVLPRGTHSAGHSRAPDMSDATRRPEGGDTPVIKTRSGRVVKKPARYADSGE
eukprot:Em0021g168a